MGRQRLVVRILGGREDEHRVGIGLVSLLEITSLLTVSYSRASYYVYSVSDHAHSDKCTGEISRLAVYTACLFYRRAGCARVYQSNDGSIC